MEYRHVPVMLEEVLEYLNPKNGEYFIDCTLGGAGYTVEIAKRVGEKGKVLAIDLDPMAIENAKIQIQKNKLNNIILENENFRNLSQIIEKNFSGFEISDFDGIVFDLGLSGAQLEDRARGFSFAKDSPLDMSFKGKGETKEIVNEWGEDDLAEIFKKYGEERFARRIARKIAEKRKETFIETTGQLVEIIKSAIPKKFQNLKIHPATKVFQALRMATNDELGSLEEVLPQAVEALKKGGRIIIISFHSLEDRIVKKFLKNESRGCICPPDFPECRCGHKPDLKIITRKPLIPDKAEVKKNPRARSAKMRVAEKIK